MKLIKYSAFAAGMFAAAAAFAANQVGIRIDAAKPGPVINKNIYGQFAEHLGSGIYGGMWVGPESSIPNTRGWRNDVVGALKNLQVPVVRWPGGCFADEYHWREGIGPRDKRPVKINNNWGGTKEDNAVGTHEFFDLVEQLGTEAYVNGNLGTGTPQEMAEWVEYMTADGESSLAQLRAKNGRAKPFKLAFFGIGNEAWGCGGHMTPEYFTNLYNHYQSFIRAPHNNKPKLIAAGGSEEWTKELSKRAQGKDVGITIHFYTLPTRDWEKKGQATGFGEDQWFSTLKETLRIDEELARHIALLNENDPKKKFSLMLDEWGTWYDPAPGPSRGELWQQNSIRDAVLAGLNLNIFHAHAERLSMTNIAQMVNVLQAMILTDKDKMVLTPTYHVFKMYVPFQDASSLPVTLSNNAQYAFGKDAIPAISASAARGKDGKLYLALVNTDPKAAQDVAVEVAGAKAKSASGSVLTAQAMDAHNSFEAPKAVVPAPFQASVKQGKLTARVPAKSVIVLTINE